MLINGDYKDYIDDIIKDNDNVIIVSDPPFNIGYGYDVYDDNKPEEEYLSDMAELFSKAPSVVIHYPETLYKIAIKMGVAPMKVVSWVYNSHVPREHRDIAFFNIMPDFNLVRQPFKNPNDKRVQQRIAKGIQGAKLYDWWNINQVKNVSSEKTEHPCQMPLEVMKNIVGILPSDATIVDPFMGSGTTGVACNELNRKFIGIELSENYYNIAKERLKYKPQNLFN